MAVSVFEHPFLAGLLGDAEIAACFAVDADLKAMLGMLDARHIAGDERLTAQLREQVTARWRRTAPGRLAELQELARRRWSTRGDASFLLEPDLKDCRGGLRDWVGLRALASAQLVDISPAVTAASTVLLDVRCELHRMAGRATDVLRGQDRSTVAESLGQPDGEGGFQLRLWWKPFVTLIWLGGAMVALGGALALAGRVWRKRRPRGIADEDYYA